MLFGLLIVSLVLARRFLVPKTFGEAGHYRAAAVQAEASRETKYAGREACASCHEDQAKALTGGHHRSLACEVCHGPAAAHVAAPMENRPPAPRERGYCQLCHGYDPSRPTGFPQVDEMLHNPRRPCFACHNPHAPDTPREPEECGACHGQIARATAVSPHALLSCTTCHTTQRQHKTAPQLSRPSKPSSRAFCGRCHSREAESSKEIPRVDMAEHGERYVCWQCHYPHFPELK